MTKPDYSELTTVTNSHLVFNMNFRLNCGPETGAHLHVYIFCVWLCQVCVETGFMHGSSEGFTRMHCGAARSFWENLPFRPGDAVSGDKRTCSTLGASGDVLLIARDFGTNSFLPACLLSHRFPTDFIVVCVLLWSLLISKNRAYVCFPSFRPRKEDFPAIHDSVDSLYVWLQLGDFFKYC